MAYLSAQPAIPGTGTAAGSPSEKARLLLVTGGFPWPITSGNAMRTWNFIHALRPHYDLALIHPCRTPPDREAVGRIQPYFSRIFSIVDDGRRAQDTFLEGVRNKVRMIPWELASSRRPLFAEAVGRVLREGGFDIMLARYIYQARYLFEWAASVPTKLVVDLDDVETVKIKRLRALQPVHSRTRKLRLDLNNWVFGQYHKRTLPMAELCLVCSEDDRNHLIRNKWASNVAVVPNAIDVSRYAAVAPLAKGRTLLFCGILDYQPNVDGICWFVREVLPHIKRREPDVSLLIVGRNAVDEVKCLASDPAVVLHENVVDVAPFYEQASIVIVPVRSGGGTRIKVLEAAACRRPIVSTTIGVEGLGLLPGRHCLIDDNAEGFAEKCIQLLRGHIEARRLGDELYWSVAARYDSVPVQESIRQLFRDVQRQPPRALRPIGYGEKE